MPLEVVASNVPWAFQARGQWHVVYELHLANVSRVDCTLTRIEVATAGASPKSLATFASADLPTILVVPGLDDEDDPSKLGAGAWAIAYLWLTFDKREEVPPAIVHRIRVRFEENGEEVLSDAPPLAIQRAPVPVLAPPLAGGDWFAGNGPSNASSHRRALIPFDGRAVIAQRFAIDWVKQNEEHATYAGDAGDNKSYFAYGSEVYAVADGVVTATRDGIPENAPGIASRAVPITLDTIAGNHVILEIGKGLYAMFAHLQPGSLRVKVGEHVQSGKIIGLVGNSGNSTEPHLHFHLCNGNSPLACEGAPYALSSFEWLGNGPGVKDAKPQTRRLEIPVERDLVRFSARGRADDSK